MTGFLQAPENDGGGGSGRGDPAAAVSPPAAAAQPAGPLGRGGGSSESMTAAFGHLADQPLPGPSASPGEARVFLASQLRQARERLRTALAGQKNAPLDAHAQAAKALGQSDRAILLQRFAGTVPPDELKRLWAEHADSLRMAAMDLQADELAAQGHHVEGSEGMNTTEDRSKKIYKVPPRL